jgi:hypothetical protein
MCSFDARKKRIDQATLGKEVKTRRRRAVKDSLPVPSMEKMKNQKGFARRPQ